MNYLVLDYFTEQYVIVDDCIRFINNVVDEILVYDYTVDTSQLLRIRTVNGVEFYNKNVFKDSFIFDQRSGYYILKDTLQPKELIRCKYNLNTYYNYDFPKTYEARENFYVFKDKQYLVNPEVNFKLSNYLPYTFGLEFETAIGTIPEDICFRDGLIPLRDGSITGNEYSTVVLQGNYGLNLLKQQLDTLKNTTCFDKNCALHIHIGGFKLDPKVIWNIYNTCLYLQTQLTAILPENTFRTSEYKNTGKDYCKLLPTFTSFDTFYKGMVSYPYFGDLFQPHPKDKERLRKWNIDKRYFWVNFINALCYNSGKTIEFRFLRTTYNLNKIVFWLYIFNAIIWLAEQDICASTLNDLIIKAYPSDISELLSNNIIKVGICTTIQQRLNDKIGERTDIEDFVFNTNELI